MITYGREFAQITTNSVHQSLHRARADLAAEPTDLGRDEVMPVARTGDARCRNHPPAGRLHRIRQLAVAHGTAVHDDKDHVVQRSGQVGEQRVPKIVRQLLRTADHDDAQPTEHR